MDIEDFIRDRRPRWKQLEQVLDLTENSPDWGLGHERIRELVVLYRQTCSDLNHARALTANPELLEYLNQLTGRAYRCVYQGRGGSETGAAALRKKKLKTFLWNHVPATFQKERSYIATAALVFAAGALFGALAVIVNPENGTMLIPAQFFTESPRERVEKIETQTERVDTAGKAFFFGASLYTHNIQVTFLAFSAGALTIVGGLLLLFYNGVILGAVGAMYYLDGVELFFLAWVGPHGALELPSIIFGGAAGIKAGSALLMPGNLTRAASIRAVFQSVWRIMVAAALLLVVAGLIEGSFSQFSTKTVPYAVKIGTAACLFSALLAYLFTNRGAPNEGTDSTSCLSPHLERPEIDLA